MANIDSYIQDIELAARGEEVRDSIVDALNAMNDGINYINYIDVTVTSPVSDSSVYTNGYKFEVDFEGVTENTYVNPTLSDLTAYIGRYAAESGTDKITLYFDTQPTANLVVRVYYFTEGDYENAETDSY